MHGRHRGTDATLPIESHANLGDQEVFAGNKQYGPGMRPEKVDDSNPNRLEDLELLQARRFQVAALVECVQDHEQIINMQRQEIAALQQHFQGADVESEASLHQLTRLQNHTIASRPQSEGMIKQLRSEAWSLRPFSKTQPHLAGPMELRSGSMGRHLESIPQRERRASSARSLGSLRASASAPMQRENVLNLMVLVMPGAVVRTATKVSLEVSRTASADEVKRRMAETGVLWGPPDDQAAEAVAMARLLFRGMTLASGIPIMNYGVMDGSMLRLIPVMGRERHRRSAAKRHHLDGGMSMHVQTPPGTRRFLSPSSRPAWLVEDMRNKSSLQGPLAVTA